MDYDFIYLPFDWGERNTAAGSPNKGYAFVNCTSNNKAKEMMKALTGFQDWERKNEGKGAPKSCKVVIAYVTDKKNNQKSVRRGRLAHINFYKNNPVMHPDVKDEYKAAIYDGEPGQKTRVPFPSSDGAVKKPRNLSKKK